MRRIDEQSVDEVWDCQLLVSIFCLCEFCIFPLTSLYCPRSAVGSAKYQCGQARWGGGQWRVVESQLEALLNGRTAGCWLPSVLMFPCTPTSASLSMSTNFKTKQRSFYQLSDCFCACELFCQFQCEINLNAKPFYQLSELFCQVSQIWKFNPSLIDWVLSCLEHVPNSRMCSSRLLRVSSELITINSGLIRISFCLRRKRNATVPEWVLSSSEETGDCNAGTEQGQVHVLVPTLALEPT